ncbi:MAG TPA: hydrogenase formation protein HypD, partial [Clostridia bacterium]|nr:hydrogenase formation protein HypD [Clostridia bacterium]
MINLQEMMDKLKNYNGKPVQFMEVCGTHTNSIFKNGIPGMLSKNIKLISGPGCPVCVTSGNYIDRTAEISMKENTVLYTFGDMIKVPGYNTSLSAAKAKGGRVEIMYSPFDVLNLAIANPSTTFVIAAVGFETTTPIYA